MAEKKKQWIIDNSWWIAPLLTLIGVIGMPNGDKTIIKHGEQATVNDFVWFLFSHDLVILLLSMVIYFSTDVLIWKTLALLAFGKVIDEFFPEPNKYHIAEVIWDIAVLLYAGRRYFKGRN